jgi:hypothetical protein
VTVGSRRRPTRQVVVEFSDQCPRNRDLALAGIALGWPDDQLAVLELGHLLDDVHSGALQVEST